MCVCVRVVCVCESWSRLGKKMKNKALIGPLRLAKKNIK